VPFPFSPVEFFFFSLPAQTTRLSPAPIGIHCLLVVTRAFFLLLHVLVET